jgi:hypothetical protein
VHSPHECGATTKQTQGTATCVSPIKSLEGRWKRGLFNCGGRSGFTLATNRAAATLADTAQSRMLPVSSMFANLVSRELIICGRRYCTVIGEA